MAQISVGFVGTLLLALCGRAFAGDYDLLVVDANKADCNNDTRTLEPCLTGISLPACTADQVAEDLERYFRGESPSIRILVPAFSNGHVRFCSSESRSTVAHAFRRIQDSGRNTRGRFLRDFISVNRIAEPSAPLDARKGAARQ